MTTTTTTLPPTQNPEGTVRLTSKTTIAGLMPDLKAQIDKMDDELFGVDEDGNPTGTLSKAKKEVDDQLLFIDKKLEDFTKLKEDAESFINDKYNNLQDVVSDLQNTFNGAGIYVLEVNGVLDSDLGEISEVLNPNVPGGQQMYGIFITCPKGDATLVENIKKLFGLQNQP